MFRIPLLLLFASVYLQATAVLTVDTAAVFGSLGRPAIHGTGNPSSVSLSDATRSATANASADYGSASIQFNATSAATSTGIERPSSAEATAGFTDLISFAEEDVATLIMRYTATGGRVCCSSVKSVGINITLGSVSQTSLITRLDAPVAPDRHINLSVLLHLGGTASDHQLERLSDGEATFSNPTFTALGDDGTPLLDVGYFTQSGAPYTFTNGHYAGQATPEPATWMLLGGGLISFGIRKLGRSRWWHRRHS